MNRSFQSWSPRTRPLIYDSLQQDVGCQDIAGSQFFASLPFNRICVTGHSAASAIFNQPKTVSYTIGPAHTGDPLPWVTNWAAWVSSIGIRVAKVASITLPDNTTGSQSALYPNTKPSKLSLGFTRGGEIALAIQKTAQTIEIKWFQNDDGSSIGTKSFLGVSPALFNNALVQRTPDSSEGDLVLYYLRTEVPRTIFARFERQGFATEHVVNSDLQVTITELLSSGALGRKQVLYARDNFKRDVTLSSPDYSVRVSSDKGKLSVSITKAIYANNVIKRTLPLERAKLSLSIVKARYGSPIKEPSGTLSGDATGLSISISSGEYV